MNCQGKNFELTKNKTILWLFLGAVVSLIIILSSILGWPPYYFLGFIFAVFLVYSIFTTPKITLFTLVIIRMVLDYPSENLYFNLTKTLSISFSQAIGMIIFLVGLAYIIKNFSSLKKLPLKIPIGAYFVFSAFTVIYSIDTFSTFKELLRLFDLAFLFFLSFSIIKSRPEFNSLLKIIFLSSLIPVLAGIYQYISNIGYTDSAFATPRIFGTLSHPNSLSLFLFAVIALLFLYYFLNKKDNFSRYAIPFLIPAYLAVLAITYTRIAWIAVFIFLFILGAVKFKKLLIPLVMLIIAAYLLFPTVQDRMADITSPSPDSSLLWREILWKDVVIETFANHKQLFGYGANTFEIAAENKRGIKFGSLAAHNDFIRAFVEGGYVGLLIFIFYTGYILTYFLFKYRHSREADKKIVFLTLFALFFAMLVSGLSDNVIRNTPLQWIFWITAGASLRVFGVAVKK